MWTTLQYCCCMTDALHSTVLYCTVHLGAQKGSNCLWHSDKASKEAHFSFLTPLHLGFLPFAIRASMSRLSVCMTCSLCQPCARHCNMENGSNCLWHSNKACKEAHFTFLTPLHLGSFLLLLEWRPWASVYFASAKFSTRRGGPYIIPPGGGTP